MQAILPSVPWKVGLFLVQSYTEDIGLVGSIAYTSGEPCHILSICGLNLGCGGRFCVNAVSTSPSSGG